MPEPGALYEIMKFNTEYCETFTEIHTLIREKYSEKLANFERQFSKHSSSLTLEPFSRAVIGP